jgi:diketogulonate reductase-like aldo/keto reductase
MEKRFNMNNNQKRLIMIFPISIILALFASCAGKAATIEQTPQTGRQSFNFENRTVTLNNGIEMPILGLGTFQLTPAQAEASVFHALTNGYRLIDTANAYMNERAVGRGIQRAGVPREDILIITKLWPSDYEDAERAIDETLARLNLEYIDLLLLHQATGNYIEGYRSMETAVRQGKVKSIGLSNFYEQRFKEIISIATIPPAVLQIESNPYVQQDAMREYAKPYGTVINSWFPLGGRVSEFNNRQTRLFNEEIITELAKKYAKSPAQIILRWHLQKGNIAIPGSRTPAYIEENINVFDFELSFEEMQRLSTLNTGDLSFDFSNADNPMFNSFTRPMDFNRQE